MNYLGLDINRRINVKGYDESKARYWGNSGNHRLLYFQYMEDLNPKQYNQLLTFRSTPRGYSHY